MKLVILTRYSRLGASSRLRTMQYVRVLRESGFDVRVSSFFDDSYLQSLYSGRRGKSDLVRFVLRRLKQCRAARDADVVWLEKEALPWFPWFAEQIVWPRGVPIVTDYDDAVFHRYDRHRSLCVRTCLGRKIDRVMSHSVLVTAGNHYLADRARIAGAAWVEVVPTVVDADAYLPLEYDDSRIRHSDGIPRIGWIGTPQTWGQYGLPRAGFFHGLAQNYGARFHLVGARLGPSREGLFDFIPWTEASEISEIRRMDIGIMPLLDGFWERGKCGYKLIQYMACGLPVVASPVGVNREIVRHGITGFLAESEAEWKDSLGKLLSDAGLRKRMGEAGRRVVLEKYSIHAQGRRVAGLLAQAARGGRLGAH